MAPAPGVLQCVAGGKGGRGEHLSHGAQAGQSGEPPGEGTAPTADPPTSVRAPCPPSLVRDGVSLRCAPPPALLAPGLPVAPARPGPPAQSPPRSGPSGRGHSSSSRLSSVGGLCVPRLRVSSASLAGLRASAPGGGGLRWEACVVGAGEGVAGGAAGLFYFYPPVAAGGPQLSKPPPCAGPTVCGRPQDTASPARTPPQVGVCRPDPSCGASPTETLGGGCGSRRGRGTEGGIPSGLQVGRSPNTLTALCPVG